MSKGTVVMIRKSLFAILALVALLATPAIAQNTVRVVASCSDLSPVWAAGQQGTPTMNTLGQLCTEPTGHISYVDVTLSADTSAYASGDLIADTQVVTGAFKVADGKGIIYSVVVIDEDDQGAAMEIYFLSANSTMGTENAAPSISDANARNILGRVSVATGDYYDLGGVRTATKAAIGITAQAASGTANMYVAAINGAGTPTYTASGLKLRIGILD